MPRVAGYGLVPNSLPCFILSSDQSYAIAFLIGSEDGRLNCGYSSFRGKRVTMEDFYDIKTSNIDGRSVCLFGIFDGKIFHCHAGFFWYHFAYD